jgi:putative ABC transport system ATP-binding protein
VPADALVARDVTKVYLVGRGVKALDQVTAEFPPGSFTVVTGPSGCGKSTLLSLLGGLERPTYGEVWLGAHCLSRMGENALARLRRAGVGFVFQAFHLLADLTAEENVAMPLRLAGRGEAEVRARVAGLLEAVGLGGRARHYPHELSGGEQQRVAVARALANRPAVLLADEPTGNLDSRSGAEVITLLRRFNREHGQTTVVATHDPALIAEASRVLQLRDGRVVAA